MTEVELKRCRHCKQLKPATAESFEKHKHCVGGITSRCKTCSNARAVRWRKDNREAIAQRWQERYAAKALVAANVPTEEARAA